MEISVLFIFLLFVIASLYSSVGHGGASGYLALMALFNFAPEIMKPTALLLNVFVAGISFSHFYKSGFFNWKLFYPFAITSIPFAFIGGLITIDTTLYKKLLGILLVFAVFRLIFQFGKNHQNKKEVKLVVALITGAIIGLFSGLIGIGGGIILSPLIVLLNWGNMKEAAAVSALFIFVNSISGLFGQFASGLTFSNNMIIMVGVGIMGGLLGGYIGSKKLNLTYLTYVLSFVLLIASAKLIFT